DSVSQSDLEGIMAQRPIGQDSFHFGAKALRQTSLDELLPSSPMRQADRIPRAEFSEVTFLATRPIYDANSVKEAIKAKGGPVNILRKGHRRLPPKKFRARHRKLARIRARIEKIFGTWKRSYHFRAMRWVGLAKQGAKSILRSLLTISSASFKLGERILTAAREKPNIPAHRFRFM
ncbi:MAG: transposase, partial [Methylocella sp.]